MKMGKQLIILSLAVASLCLMVGPVQAGSPQQYRWEGVAIGVGAAVLGHTLLSSHSYGPHYGGSATYAYTYRSYPAPYRHHDNRRWHHGRDYRHYYHGRRDYHPTPHGHGGHRATPPRHNDGPHRGHQQPKSSHDQRQRGGHNRR